MGISAGQRILFPSAFPLRFAKRIFLVLPSSSLTVYLRASLRCKKYTGWSGPPFSLLVPVFPSQRVCVCLSGRAELFQESFLPQQKTIHGCNSAVKLFSKGGQRKMQEDPVFPPPFLLKKLLLFVPLSFPQLHFFLLVDFRCRAGFWVLFLYLVGIDMWLLRDGRRSEGTSPGINRFPLLQTSGIFLFSSPPRISGEEKEVPTLLSVDRPCGKRQQPSTFGIERETHVSRLFCCWWHSKAPRASVDIFSLFLSLANVKLGSVSLFQ